ncbi:MAG: hypothetical protein ACQES4_08010 [Bacillota bacterium]
MFNKLKKLLTAALVVLMGMAVLTGCGAISENGAAEPAGVNDDAEKEVKNEELEEDVLSEEDFALNIGTLPYRGAVLFIDYDGKSGISSDDVMVDIKYEGEVKQKDMPIEIVNGEYIVTIVDFMYLAGSELDFIIKISSDNDEKQAFSYSKVFEGYYSWKDWMLDLDEKVTYDNLQYPLHHVFKYDYPDCGNQLGVHASWDFYTQDRTANVYSGTKGIIYRVIPESNGNLEVYNPYVGAIVQYGHTLPAEEIHAGKIVEPGDYIANVIDKWGHIHYAVIRPLDYSKNIQENGLKHLSDDLSEMWDGYYWPVIGDIYATRYYKDPFYFREPTILGYWYEESLPDGIYDGLIEVFLRENPYVDLPVKQ